MDVSLKGQFSQKFHLFFTHLLHSRGSRERVLLACKVYINGDPDCEATADIKSMVFMSSSKFISSDFDHWIFNPVLINQNI